MKLYVTRALRRTTCPVWVFVAFQLIFFSGISKSIDLTELDLLAKLPADDIPRGREGRVFRGGASVDLAESGGILDDVPVGAVKRNPASLGWLMAAAMRLCDERPGDCVGGPMRLGAEMDLASLLDFKKRRVEGAKDFRISNLHNSFNDDLATRRHYQLSALIG